MATVTGTLNDFNLQSLASYSPRVVFTASEPAASPARLFSTKPIMVTPNASGGFTVELQPTTQLVPEGVFYRIRIEWLDSTGGFVGVDFVDWPLLVPDTGGSIQDLLDVAPGTSLVWVGLVPPPEDPPKAGRLWLVMNPLNPNDPANTGELNVWRP